MALTEIDLSPHPTEGHSSDHTIALAGAVSDAIRALNYATLAENAADAVPYPSTAYDVIGRLSAAAAGLDQLCRQLADRFAQIDRDYSDALYVSHGPDADDPESAVGTVMDALTIARGVSEDFRRALDSVHEALSPIGLRLDIDDDKD